MKSINKIAAVLLLLFGVMACEMESFDEVAPVNKLTEDNAFNSADKVEYLLNGVYLTWRRFGYMPGYLMAYGGNYQWRSGSDYDINAIEADARYPSDAYKLYYIMIQKANFLIEAMQSSDNIADLTAVRRAEVEGEARLQRGWAHFELLRIFGQSWDLGSKYGIVVNLEPQRAYEVKARNTVQEVYDAVLADLDFAIANAPATSDAHKMSQVTAKAVKAQVLLTMNDFAGAAQLASEVMQNGHYKLEDEYDQIFWNGFYSDEFLFTPWAVNYSDALSLDVTGIYFPVTDQLTKMADAEVGDPDDGDMTTGDGFDKRFAIGHASDLLPPTIRHGKYPHRRARDQQANSQHILRLAEVYLIYAEAKARLTAGVDADAVEAMNVVRRRADMPEKQPGSKAELLEAIRIEKNMELFLEWAQPWHDMVRYHKLGDIDIKTYRPNITNDDRLVWPIPETALVANNKLIQNPGY